MLYRKPPEKEAIPQRNNVQSNIKKINNLGKFAQGMRLRLYNTISDKPTLNYDLAEPFVDPALRAARLGRPTLWDVRGEDPCTGTR